MSRKNIAIICVSKGFGGLELNTLKLAEWLRKYGWNVSLMVAKDSEMERNAGSYCDSVFTTDVHGTFGKMKAIRKWLKVFDASVLFTPHNKDIAAISLYKRLVNNRVKQVYQQQMQIGMSKKDLIHTFRYGKIDLWISPLNYLREEAALQTRVPLRKIAVVPLGIEVGRFLNNPVSRTDAREKLSLPQEPKMIGVLGRIDPKKGQDFLIKAIDHLRNNPSQNYHLLIMGAITPNEGDHYLKSLYQLVADNNLTDRVHFRESTSDVELFYSAIDVFGMPSHGETFGMVTIEAMASRKPVVGTNRCGTKEILQDGKLGYLYEYENMDDFTQKLAALEHNAHLPEMLEAARIEVIQKYTSEIMCRGLDEVMTKLIEK
ncbi:glycosyltransferase family 4 protein [Taibaiella soli]|uniref:Glycosyl transferase family 1 domain-containing protein n=1 Tax=Taibaiella soli TaxID=1649169 RepID=A0A2W2BD96_9BACT|nr:glycosyltransferase family 4 protein [Taibaiella soli]PZF73837.1 hypothetical protein DN068_05700 [Taibaiella soli]